MKRQWRVLALIGIMAALALGSVACTKKAEEVKPKEKTEGKEETGTRTFTDSAGREVEIPKVVKKVVPSGPVAQTVLYTACPDELVGIAAEFSSEAKKFIDEKYTGLPMFGQFYGKNANLNMEALIAAAPDVVIDIGEAKETIREDMDKLQEQIGIPVVFIEAGISTMDTAYEKLGELLGKEKELNVLADYCKETIALAEKTVAGMEDGEKKSIYMAIGEEGLNTNAKGSFHAQILDIIGIENVAQMDVNSGGGVSEVSFEQIAAWNPSIIITYTEKVYDKITTDPVWAEIEAVKSKQVYKVPTAPYNFVSDPPSVNRMIGIHWLGNLLYPDKYEFSTEDMITFYKDFYHLELSKEQAEETLKYAVK